MTDAPVRIAVAIGSTREGRFADTVARWFVGEASALPSASRPPMIGVEVVCGVRSVRLHADLGECADDDRRGGGVRGEVGTTPR